MDDGEATLGAGKRQSKKGKWTRREGVLTALGAMLAEEMDVPMDELVLTEAPAEKEYVNYILGREFILGGKKVTGIVQDTVNGAFMAVTKGMGLQITGGSASVRFTATLF